MKDVAVPSSTATDQGAAIHVSPNTWYSVAGTVASSSRM